MPREKPVLLFAYANDRRVDGRPLRNLPAEQRAIQQAFERPLEHGQCDVVELSHATRQEVFDKLLSRRWGDKIAVFHFAGHAGDGAIVLENDTGAPAPAHADGLASVLGRQQALQLVFLNGCATEDHAAKLFSAGVPAVIVTSQAIDDGVAAELAGRFYQGLAAGRSIQRSFDDATATLMARFGAERRGAYHRSFVPDDAKPLAWPWKLSAGRAREWRLPWSTVADRPAHRAAVGSIDVFVSVADSDREHADRLAQLLDEQGRTVAISDRLADPATAEATVEAARMVIVLLSEASAASVRQADEARFAESRLQEGTLSHLVPCYLTGDPGGSVEWDLGLWHHNRLDVRRIGLEEAARKLGDLLAQPLAPASTGPPSRGPDGDQPERGAPHTYGGYFHQAALKIDRTKQWVPIVDTCSGRESAMFLLHGPRQQSLDLFIFRIWTYLAERCPHQICVVPFRRFFAKPRSVPEWENHVRYALGGDERGGTAEDLLGSAARGGPVLLVLGQVPITAGSLDDVERDALLSFLRGRLPTLMAQAAADAHPVRVLVATHYDSENDALVDALDQALVEGAGVANLCHPWLPTLEPLTWGDIEDFLKNLPQRLPHDVYRRLRAAWERLDRGGLSFREIVSLLTEELF